LDVRRRWRWLSAVTLVVAATVPVGVRVAAASDAGPHAGDGIHPQVAGGCWDDGCNFKYYNSGGAACYDAYHKSNTVYGTFGSSTQWSVEVRYSHACGAGYAYVHNLTESGANCHVDLWRTDDFGASWSFITDEFVETPTYNFAFTAMIGDYDAPRKLRAQVVCAFNGGGTAFSGWANET